MGGILLIFGPAQSLFSWIPIVGDVTGFLFFVVAALIGLIISLTTISVSWIAVRPLLGVALLVIAAVSLFFLFKLRKSVKDEPPVIDSGMFVQ